MISPRRVPADVCAVLALLLLWTFFFWHTLTPSAKDQYSLHEGDFSAQFVAFGSYQYARITAGEFPLWNPYNNGGFPFVADPQAAAAYPPRFLTIALAHLAGGWSYHTLELEGVFHSLFYSLMWYAFLRRLTFQQAGSRVAAFAGAIVAAYGGFMSGYPLLQLAILEAATWLPLVLLGILEATRSPTPRWTALILAGFALGISWLAGHPQTAWFCTVLSVAWLTYRLTHQRTRWQSILLANAVLGVTTLGVCAITFLPSAEYLLYTTRADLDFAAKANGFPLRDVIQFVLPNTVSAFSPLYVGIMGLFLSAIALLTRRASLFWGIVALVALLLSFGGNAPFYGWLYPLPIGLSLFRGQERFAFVVSAGFAVMTAYGVVTVAEGTGYRLLFRVSILFSVALIASALMLGALAFNDSAQIIYARSALQSAILGIGVLLALMMTRRSIVVGLCSLALLLVVDLTLVSVRLPAVWDHRPPPEQLIQASQAIKMIQNDPKLMRVDAFRGIGGNYASVFAVNDIRGISPLFLTSANQIIYADYGHNRLAWELFAVKYVFSERESFSTPTQIMTETVDAQGKVFLHVLEDPRPFAHFIQQVDKVDSDAFAWALLNDSRYQPRQSIILNQTPTLTLDRTSLDQATVIVEHTQPEALTLSLDTPANAILSLAMVDYPGWTATLDGIPVPILRAYGALQAIEVPAGRHTLQLTFLPVSFMMGVIISLITWLGVMIAMVRHTRIMRRNPLV